VKTSISAMDDGADSVLKSAISKVKRHVLPLFVIMFIDGTWGTFIHAGENLIRDGRLGVLNRLVLTPSHHRVHHSRNPLYIDTNFGNPLNVWDRVFGTWQDEHRETPPEYGITRAMKPGSFWDFYFGELVALSVDVKNAPGLRNKLAYIVMPPGWNHTGQHKTASAMRQKMLAAAVLTALSAHAFALAAPGQAIERAQAALQAPPALAVASPGERLPARPPNTDRQRRGPVPRGGHSGRA